MLAATVLGLGLAGCASLPPLPARSDTTAAVDTDATTLARALAPAIAAHPGLSGVHALPLGSDAFAARAVLAMTAEKTLDLQYYVWQSDQTGMLLLELVRRAADRGVRVRMLLDDANTKGQDELLAALDAHPLIEVRLYNPFVHRNRRALDFALDFGRVNRRMHNKSFTADNRVTIVGGRNVGNVYFGAGEGVAFKDLDVMSVGAAVRDVSSEFDLYWSSASAYPLTAVLGARNDDATTLLDERFEATRADPVATAYREIVRQTPLLRQLVDGRLAFEWTEARVVRDDPAKTLDQEERTDHLLLTHLLGIMGRAGSTFDLISPYFVPGDVGTESLVRLARDGVKVRVLTNSLASTDVAVVHAGYAKRRCELLRAGVQLFELKASGAAGDGGGTRPGGSSATALHAKTFAIDRRRVFVGSFNFDPRSARLNTEMGLVIDSEALAASLGRAFDVDIPGIAYEVRLDAAGACAEWIERTPGGPVVHPAEPATRASQRVLIDLLSILPIDWLL